MFDGHGVIPLSLAERRLMQHRPSRARRQIEYYFCRATLTLSDTRSFVFSMKSILRLSPHRRMLSRILSRFVTEKLSKRVRFVSFSRSFIYKRCTLIALIMYREKKWTQCWCLMNPNLLQSPSSRRLCNSILPWLELLSSPIKNSLCELSACF